jgi:AAA ATPase domain
MSRPLTLQDLEKFLGSPTPSQDLEGYLDAAAVLDTFDLFKLQAAGSGPSGSGPGRLIDELLPLCEQVPLSLGRGVWSLTLSPRRAALRRMGTRQKMQAALAANPVRPQTAVQQMWERVLGTSPIPIEDLSREELAALTTVIEWAEDILDWLPDAPSIRKALRRADLLAPMRRLTESGFVGRENELAQLSAYVFDGKPQVPLYVFGSGGVGKSTLLAHFILKFAVPRNAVIVYLDLDRPTVRPDVPLTLLLDAVNQMHGQVDAANADSVIKEITYAISRVEGGRALEWFSPNTQVDPYIAQSMQNWVRGRPLVFIVDTLEDAQFFGPDVMYPLLEFVAGFDRSVLDHRSLNIDAFDQIYVLMGHALPEEA